MLLTTQKMFEPLTDNLVAPSLLFEKATFIAVTSVKVPPRQIRAA
jgi:hypothetical protein